MKLAFTLSLCFFLGTITLLGQTKSTPTVTITPDTRSIETPPFDVKFAINSFKTTYSDIDFSYKINTDNVDGLYFKSGSQNLSVNPSTGMAHFTELVGPIHPDQSYTFSISGKRYIKLTEAEEKVLRDGTYELVETYFPTLDRADNVAVDAFNLELLNLLKQTAKVALTDKLMDKTGVELGTARLGNSYINTTIAKNDQLKVNIATQENNFKTNGEGFNRTINLMPNLFEALSKIDDGSIQLSTAAKALYDAPVNTSVTENKTLTMRALFSFLNQNETVYFESIFKKGAYQKLKGNTLVSSDKLDRETLVLLKSAFEKLNYEFFKDSSGNAIHAEIVNIKEAVRYLGVLLTTIDQYNKEKEALANLKDEIPNILKNAFAKEEISFSKSVDINVFAENNAYIGLDLGLLYGADIDGVFSFQSVNFYFTPVNREAPFRNYQKQDRLWKRLSLYVGLAQLLSDKPDDFDSLLAKNSLMMGIGYRLSRVLRLSVGGMLHKKVDTRVLVDDFNLKVSPTVSLSVDVDLTKALGAIGNAIKL